MKIPDGKICIRLAHAEDSSKIAMPPRLRFPMTLQLKAPLAQMVMYINSICVVKICLHNCWPLYFFIENNTWCTCSVFWCGLTKALLVGSAESFSCPAGTRKK